MSDTAPVEIGQVWEDTDWRMHGRRIRIEIINKNRGVALVRVVSNGESMSRSVGRTTRIRLDRFKPTSTGYRLVTPAPAASPEEEDTEKPVTAQRISPRFETTAEAYRWLNKQMDAEEEDTHE